MAESIVQRRVDIRVRVVRDGVTRDLREIREEVEEAAAASSSAVEETAQTAERASTRVSKSVEKTSIKLFKDFSKIRSTTLSMIGTLTKSIGRIAFYRTIRSAIKLFTSGIGEGLKNFIHYSSEARASMDQFTTASTYLKNSIGAALMPMLMNLIPVFQQVVNWIVKGVEAISMWFAYINGNTTYTRANPDYFVAWEDGAEKATKKVKELKNSILGFDEINALSDNTSSSSSGSSAGGLDYNNMFEEAAINMDTVNRVQDILEIVKQIGLVLAGFFVAKEVVGFVSSLLTLFSTLKSMGVVGKLGVAALTFAIEAILVFNSMKNIFKGKGTAKDWIIAGIATALGVAIGAVTFGPAGAVVGLAVSFVATSLALDRATYEDTELYRVLKKAKSDLDDLEKRTQEVLNNINSRNSGFNDTLEKFNRAKTIIDKIYEFADKQSKTDGDIAIIKGLIGELDEMGLGGVIGEFNELTGTLTNTKKEAEDVLKTMLKTEMISYASENISKALLDKEELKAQLKDYETVANTILSTFYNKDIKSMFVNDDLEKFINGLKSGEWKSFEAFVANNSNLAEKAVYGLLSDSDRYKINEIVDEYLRAKSDIDKTQEAIDKVNKELKKYSEILDRDFTISTNNAGVFAIQTYSSIVTFAKSAGIDISSDMAGVLANLTGDISLFSYGTKTSIVNSAGEIVATVKAKADDLKTYLQNLNPELNIDVKYNYQYSFDYRVAISIDDPYSTETETKATVDYLKTHSGGNTVWDNYIDWKNIPMRANGGFVEDGLFFANHGELVGQFNNGRTAVANNEQIIEGIYRGVRDAMNDSNGGGGDWTIQIIDGDGNVRGQTTVTAAERINKRAGTTVVPVGV